MKFAIVAILLACVVSAYSSSLFYRHKTGKPHHHITGPVVERGFGAAHQKFKAKVEESMGKAWHAIYEEHLSGNGCSEEDFIKLHVAHGKSPKIIVEEWENWDTKFAEFKAAFEDDDEFKGLVKEMTAQWPHIQRMLQLSDSCTHDQVTEAFQVLFDARRQVYDKFKEQLTNDLPDGKFQKFHDAVVGYLKHFLTKLREHLFPDSGCTDEDLYHVGNALHHLMESVPKKYLKKIAGKILKGEFTDKDRARTATFREIMGISSECSVDDIHGITQGLIEHHKEIAKHFFKGGEGLGKGLEGVAEEHARLDRRRAPQGFCDHCSENEEETVLRAIARATGQEIDDDFFKVRRVFRRILN